MRFKVFISYSSKDTTKVEQVKKIFDNSSIDFFEAEQSILLGESILNEIKSNIKSCDLFLLLWSRNSKKSEWVQKEIGIAISEEKSIIPVILDKKIPVPDFLKDIKYLKFDDDPEEALELLRRNVFNRAQKKAQQEGLVWLGIGIAILFLIGRN